MKKGQKLREWASEKTTHTHITNLHGSSLLFQKVFLDMRQHCIQKRISTARTVHKTYQYRLYIKRISTGTKDVTGINV